MFGETVVDHEKKWQRFKRAFNDRYTELRSELSEARNMADIYERSLAQKTDSSKSEEIEAGIIALKLIGRARLPKGSSDRYPKILEGNEGNSQVCGCSFCAQYGKNEI